MKYIGLAFIALLFAACNHSQGDIVFIGTASGINYGNIVITDQANNTLYRARVEDGKFNLGKQYLQASGYYKLVYTLSTQHTRRIEVYLEPGQYTINLDQQKINDYPLITTSSKTQTQLSAYYTMADSLNKEARKNVAAINAKINGLTDQVLKPGQYIASVDSLQTEELKANQIDNQSSFKAFMQKYPDNLVAAHLLLNLNYQDDPVGYYKMFEQFNTDAKSSDDGKELENKLKPLLKMATGAAPVIAGTTPDGKEVNIKAQNKKIILLDFWRSTNGTSRDNHQQMLKSLLPQFGAKGLGIVSVSFDTNKEKWTTAITHDGVTWPQLSDLKGDDSPNAENWAIKSIPSYYLLDGEGHMIKHVADFNDLDTEISKYLAKH